jgi:hypothetical protein
MNEQELLQRIQLLEYHQNLLVMLLDNPKLDFYKLIIKSGLKEQDVQQFFLLCDKLNIKWEEQKAEGFVYFHPLFAELSASLPPNLNVNEVIQACLNQKLYDDLFQELQKYCLNL